MTQMTRRTATGLLAASILSLATGRKADAGPLTGRRVAVVGAGIAGLGAAQKLRAFGAEVTVFEATDQIGGRIRTDRSLGAPIEMGAGWIHGPSGKNPIMELVSQTGAETFVTDDDNLEVYYADGTELGEDVAEALEELWDDFEDALWDELEAGDTRSLRTIIDDIDPEVLQSPEARWMLSSYIEFDLGAPLGEVSAALAQEDGGFPGDDVILTGGYDRLLEPLAAGLDIRLNTRIRRILHGDTGGVETADGIEAFDNVVCAVPLGVLKSGSITFDPPLPARYSSAIDGIGMGTVTKIALAFDEPFWDTETQYFGVVTEPMGRWSYWMNYRTFSDANILVGLSFGDYAKLADKMTEPEAVADAMAVLRGVAGDIPDPIGVLNTRWSLDPNFRGAYSFPKAGAPRDHYDVFDKPASARLVFAGEHTTFDYHSTTYGALLSGRWAAEWIADP